MGRTVSTRETDMPVSKKRKKEGKPVHRSHPAPTGEEHAAGPEAKPSHPQSKMGKPSNPFVTMQQAKRGAQRGR
jgi:hypothetical protein